MLSIAPRTYSSAWACMSPRATQSTRIGTTATFGIEFALISLFTVFWGIQTKDLWHEGLR